MDINYKTVESTVEPLSIEFFKNTVYLRKDISSESRNIGDRVITYYTYQEAILTPEEFNEYSSQIAAKNAINGVDNADNIVKLITNQQIGDDNRLAIMEAIADLYEAIATAIA